MKKPTTEKQFIPDNFLNTIKHCIPQRVPQRTVWAQKASPLEANFATWEEAHAWLVARRASEVEAAKSSLASAQRLLAKARKMQPNPEWRSA